MTDTLRETAPQCDRNIKLSLTQRLMGDPTPDRPRPVEESRPVFLTFAQRRAFDSPEK